VIESRNLSRDWSSLWGCRQDWHRCIYNRSKVKLRQGGDLEAQVKQRGNKALSMYKSTTCRNVMQWKHICSLLVFNVCCILSNHDSKVEIEAESVNLDTAKTRVSQGRRRSRQTQGQGQKRSASSPVSSLRYTSLQHVLEHNQHDSNLLDDIKFANFPQMKKRYILW